MDVQMKLVLSKPSHQVPILSFLDNSKTACDSNEIYEEAAMWLFQNFMKDHANDALAYRVCSTEIEDP